MCSLNAGSGSPALPTSSTSCSFILTFANLSDGRLVSESVSEPEEMIETSSSSVISIDVFCARASTHAPNCATDLYINFAGRVKDRVGATWQRSSQTCNWTFVGLYLWMRVLLGSY